MFQEKILLFVRRDVCLIHDGVKTFLCYGFKGEFMDLFIHLFGGGLSGILHIRVF